MTVYEIIKKPVITEKTELLRRGSNVYTFEVDPKANKIEIKKAVEKVFGVKVGSVNTINVKPTTKRYGMRLYKNKLVKKAIVKVLEGTIEYFPEV